VSRKSARCEQIGKNTDSRACSRGPVNSMLFFNTTIAGMKISITIPKFHAKRRDEAYFLGVHTGAELDLLIRQNGRNIGFEFKLTRSPKVTASMRSACEVWELDQHCVVCHGSGDPWPQAKGIIALPALCLISSNWAP
jgi:hypothetical protein